MNKPRKFLSEYEAGVALGRDESEQIIEKLEAENKRLKGHFLWLQERLGSPAIEGYVRFAIKVALKGGK